MPEREIQSDHFPEVVDNNKAMRLLELLGMRELLAEPQRRAEFFASLDDAGYLRMLGYINSRVRNKPTSYELANGRLPMLSTPPLEAKDPLVRETFAAVRKVLQQDHDQETLLRRAGLTISGAINYIHPYLDGNGRTARVMHYLIEFGTGRGEVAFNDELYATVAKLPAYEGQSGDAMDDAPYPEVTESLATAVQESGTMASVNESPSDLPSLLVRKFLETMVNQTPVRLVRDAPRVEKDPRSRGERTHVIFRAGSIDAMQLYEHDYLARSAVPNYQPSEVEQAHRVMGVRGSDARRLIIDLDVLPRL